MTPWSRCTRVSRRRPAAPRSHPAATQSRTAGVASLTPYQVDTPRPSPDAARDVATSSVGNAEEGRGRRAAAPGRVSPGGVKRLAVSCVRL